MNGVNQVTLIGNLGADPELRFTKDGKGICNFRLAINTSYYNYTTKQRKENLEWVSCVAFNNADYLGKTMVKGTLVHVFGAISSRSYEDKQGIKRYITEVRCQEVNLLGKFGAKPGEDKRNSAPSADMGDDNIPF